MLLAPRQFDLSRIFSSRGARTCFFLRASLTLRFWFAALFQALWKSVCRPVQGCASLSPLCWAMSARSRRARPRSGRSAWLLAGSGRAPFSSGPLLEPAKYFIEKGRLPGLILRFLRSYRRGLRWCDPSYRGLLTNRFGFRRDRGQCNVLSRFFYHLITGLNFAELYIVMTQSGNAVVRRFQMHVRD